MRRIVFELTCTDDGEFRITTHSGSVPSHQGVPTDDAGLLANYDHCVTPGDVLREYADALDRAMALAWWDDAQTLPPATGGLPS